MISKEDVKHIAWLARLEITEKEIEKFTQQLGQILQHASKIKEVNTQNIKPTAHPQPLKNVFREDVAKESITLEKALKNAPKKESGAFTVPRIS